MKNYVFFKHPYVLVEDARGKYRPIYKEYTKSPPALNLNSPPLCCPFYPATKRRLQNKKRDPGPKPGYCEICYTKYENYQEHISTQEHVEYAEDNSNYKKVDEFIERLNKRYVAYNMTVLRSPCDKLEAGFAHDNTLNYSSGCKSRGALKLSDTSLNESTPEILLGNIDSYDLQEK